MANDSAHARDLGYLDRFIQKLEDQARDLPDGPRQQALGLLGEQRSQWATIMGLLSGTTPERTAEPPAAMPSPSAAVPAPIPTTSRTPIPGGLTVGSLIGYP
jgi:hypothetical protein